MSDFGIDFDGTCVTHEYPSIGKDIGAAPILRGLVKQGHRLILNTMRSNIPDTEEDLPEGIQPAKAGNYLDDAVEWFAKNGIELWGINENPEQASWTSSPKIYAHTYIDDAALGIPLKHDPTYSSRAFVNWQVVGMMLNVTPVLDSEAFPSGRPL